MFDDWDLDINSQNESKNETDMTNKQTETIVEETQRESIINRPHNLAGSIKRVFKDRYAINESGAEYKTSSTIPALMKLFMEALDNPIDVAIKGGDENVHILYKAMCKYNTSSNYTDQKGQGQKGVNGIGIKLCSTLSTYFEAITDDGIKQVQLVATQNNLKHTIKESKTTKKTGVKVTFEPDFNIFDCDSIDEEHIARMYEYTLIQSLTYPNIKFTFNGKKVNCTAKKFLSLFGDDYILEQSDDYFFAFYPNDSDEFKQISFINGLETSKGGSHIDYVTNIVVNNVRTLLLKKYKTLKPADVKNKLLCVVIAKNMKNIDWDGQTKESITSPMSVMKDYFEDTNFENLSKTIFKNKAFIEPITEVYRIKEEFKRRQDMKALTKPVKKIKSEKYFPPIGEKKRLFIAEGDSAIGGLIPVLGRKGNGFYALKGAPLNCIQATHDKFLKNVEMSELFKIINAEGYEEIVFATDADLDGIHIRGLLMGFFKKMLPKQLDNLGVLFTPVKVIKKGGKPVRWSYDLNGELTAKAGEQFKYVKGLGTWNDKDLKYIIEKDGLGAMIKKLVFNENSFDVIDKWLEKDTQYRKELISNNDFSIVKL